MATINEKKIQISAVIPLYNAEKYIAATIDSLLNQSYELDEIIVVDDCGHDRSAEIVKIYCEKFESVRLIHLEKNQGGSAARNRGIKEAKNEWILLMDADDIAAPTLLEHEVKLLSESQGQVPEVILVHPAYQQIDEDGNIYENSVFRGKQMEFEEQFGTLLVRNHIITPSGLLVKRQAVIEVGGFQSFRIIEDYDFILRMSQAGSFVYVEEPLLYFRRHATSITKDISKAKDAERAVIEQYGLKRIKEAVYKRHLPSEQNQLDFVSMLYRFDMWEEGFQELTAIDNIENNNTAIFLQALYFLNCKEFDKAEMFFKQILDKNANHGAALNNRAVLYALKGNNEKARQLFEKALYLYPGYMDVNNNLAVLNNGNKEFKWTWRELRPNLLRYSE